VPGARDPFPLASSVVAGSKDGADQEQSLYTFTGEGSPFTGTDGRVRWDRLAATPFLPSVLSVAARSLVIKGTRPCQQEISQLVYCSSLCHSVSLETHI